MIVIWVKAMTTRQILGEMQRNWCVIKKGNKMTEQLCKLVERLNADIFESVEGTDYEWMNFFVYNDCGYAQSILYLEYPVWTSDDGCINDNGEDDSIDDIEANIRQKATEINNILSTIKLQVIK
jgi:hypothetical protein